MADFVAAITLDYRSLLAMLVHGGAGIRASTREARDRGDKYGEHVGRVAMTQQLEGVLHALNAHVDTVIQACHQTTKKTLTVGDTRLQRDDRLKILEQTFAFSRSDLAGWVAVQQTNSQASALKHRSGYSLAKSVSGANMALKETVELDEHELLGRLDDVHSWTVELATRVGLGTPQA